MTEEITYRLGFYLGFLLTWNPRVTKKEKEKAKSHVMSRKIQTKTAQIVDDFYLFSCPHCNGEIHVKKNEVNCCIFRHGAFKKPDLPPVPPHLSKEECDALLERGEVYGCMKPFRFVRHAEGNYVEACGYI